MIYIYGLTDPDTGKVRYIGKSIQPYRRYWNHFQCVERCHRTNWLRSLRREGKLPGLRILWTIHDGEDWQRIERVWIEIGKMYGWPLTNATEGGDGVVGLSPEGKAKIAMAFKGKKHTKAALKKIGAASKGRLHTAEWRDMMRKKMSGRKITWMDKVKVSLCKLPDGVVRRIRKMHSRGIAKIQIARTFKVNRYTVYHILNGRTYQHVK